MIYLSRACIPFLLSLGLLSPAYGETYDEALKRTNPSNPEQVLILAQWCQDNNLPTKARQHLFQVLKLDKDHLRARTLLGQVRVGDRWVAKNQLKEESKNPARKALTPLEPPPAAKDIAWNLQIVKDPSPTNQFVDNYIERMQTEANDSNAMEVSISTLLEENNWPMSLPRLCAALQKPTFTDLSGPSGVLQGLRKDGRLRDAKILFPYVVVASARCTDPEDLTAFAYIAGQMRDKRAVPRLIELMNDSRKEVAEAAGEAVSTITALSPKGITVASANAWWGEFHASDDLEILRRQLQSKDASTALAAASQLGALQEKKVIDVLILMLKSEDVKIATKAHQLVIDLTGRDWAYVATDPLDQRLKRVDRLAKWWKENSESFVFPVDPWLVDTSLVQNQDSLAADPLRLAVNDLAATDAKLVAKAENELLRKAGAAVPALIEGVADENPITARKCHELLQRISKKCDISFSPRDRAEHKHQAIAAWKAWALANKFLAEDTADEVAGN